MNGKQRTLIVLKALFAGSRNNGDSDSSTDPLGRDYIQEKLNACLTLERPDVLLDEDGKKRFEEIAEKLARQGKIIYGKN